MLIFTHGTLYASVDCVCGFISAGPVRLWLSVCQSTAISWHYIKPAGWIELIFWHTNFTDLSHTELWWASPKMNVYFNWTLIQTLNLEKFCHGLSETLLIVDRRWRPVYHTKRPSLCITRWAICTASISRVRLLKLRLVLICQLIWFVTGRYRRL